MHPAELRRSGIGTFLQHQDRVYGYIVLMLPNRHDAEDVFQQTSLILWQKWDQFDPEQDFLSWACGIARNVGASGPASAPLSFAENAVGTSGVPRPVPSPRRVWTTNVSLACASIRPTPPFAFNP